MTGDEDVVTIMFQDPDQTETEGDRRTNRQKARLVWDDNTRKVLASVIAEACSHTVEDVMKRMGVSTTVHAEHHQAMSVLIPFVQSLKEKADGQAKFFNKITEMLTSDVRQLVRFVLWLAVLSIPFGLSGGFKLLQRLIGAD